MNLKRIFCGFMVLIMLGATFAVNAFADNKGYFDSQAVFETGGSSYFRIPNIITTNSGAVFAFCNDRQDSVSDSAPVQWISYSVAKDGKNFSEPEYILNRKDWGYYIGAAIYDAVNDNIMLVYTSAILSDDAKAKYNAMSDAEKAQNPIGNAIIESSDGGKSWSCRSIMLPESRVYPYKTLNLHGASAGIQLKYGEHAGRLVFAAKSTSTNTVSTVKNYGKECVAMMMYSDDFGKTWKVSLNAMPAYTDESTLCELPDGSIYMSSRAISNDNGRYVAVSTDGGKTLSDKKFDKSFEVLCEYGIKGSVINIPDYNGKGESLTLFASLNTPSVIRRNLCVWISYDEGQTWTGKTVIDSGLCGYADMTYNPNTELISIAYERGDRDWYTDGIAVATFDIDWLLSSSVPNTPLRGTTDIDENTTPKLITESLIGQFNGEGLKDFEGKGIWYNSANISSSVDATAMVKKPDVTENALNGYKALTFNGENTVSIPTSNLINGNMTYFIVFKSDVKKADDQTLLYCDNSNGIRTVLGSVSESVTSYYAEGMYYYVQGREYIDTEWHIVAVTWNGDNANSAMLTQYTDGNVSLKYEIGKNVVRKNDNGGNITLGSQFEGSIAEVLVYNSCLDDTAVASIGLMLAEKYELTWSLSEKSEQDSNENADNGASTDVSEVVSGTENGDGETDSEEKPEKKRGCSSSVSIMGGAVTAGCAIAACGALKKRKTKNERKKK